MHDRNRDYILGIDTSNYKTSAAVTDRDGNIICDLRRLLAVKQGERGLRQSYALFQHVENLPILLKEALAEERGLRVAAVAASAKPRAMEGSYMPVFKAGEGFGRSLAAALSVPFFAFSHQEGHIEAVRHRTPLAGKTAFLAWHLSGGTCELLSVCEDKTEIIGGSRDISFGQLIDRVGVAMGMTFPAGEEMDRRALDAEASEEVPVLKQISISGLHFNLSGIETQAQRLLDGNQSMPIDENCLIRCIFDRIAQCICQVTAKAAEERNLRDVLFTGGVASSAYIMPIAAGYLKKCDVTAEFGDQTMSQDNAAGIALLGGKQLWL